MRPVDGLDADIRQIFLGEGSEPLTDELIDELVSGGWEREGIEYARDNGGAYSRPRHSLIFPNVEL